MVYNILKICLIRLAVWRNCKDNFSCVFLQSEFYAGKDKRKSISLVETPSVSCSNVDTVESIVFNRKLRML